MLNEASLADRIVRLSYKATKKRKAPFVSVCFPVKRLKSMKQENRNTVGAVLWLALSCVLHIVLFRSKLDMSIPVIRRLLYVVLAVVFTLPLHELIHCVFMKMTGMKSVRIEFARDPLGIPSLRASAQGEIRGKKRILVFLAPFILLTLVPDILFLLHERIPFLFFIMALCNAAGCCFDVADIARSIRDCR